MPTMLPHGVGAEQQISQIAKCCVKHIIEQREIDSYIPFLAGIERDTHPHKTPPHAKMGIKNHT